MTGKRFRISQGYSDKFCHDWEKNKLLNFRQTVDLLNALHEENEQLKNMVEHNYVEHKRCVNNYVDKIKEVEKENEMLKNEIKDLNDVLARYEEKELEK